MFDQMVQQQIKDYINPSLSVPDPVKQEKQPLADWQKYMENGEYLRSAEMSEEQNYNMIDGRRNNTAPKKSKRTSVLTKLHQKQAGIVNRSDKNESQINGVERITPDGNIERDRK